MVREPRSGASRGLFDSISLALCLASRRKNYHWILPLHALALRASNHRGTSLLSAKALRYRQSHRLLRLGKRVVLQQLISLPSTTRIRRHRECYAVDEEGLPMHPTYVGIHFMELDSSLDASQNKVCGFSHLFRFPVVSVSSGRAHAI